MSQGRKKNRKSKLEVREDCDYEQHTEPDLQHYLNLLKADHDYTSVEHIPGPIQLAIKVEVEEFDDNIPYEAEPSDTPSTSKAHLDNDMIKSAYQHISTLKRYGNRGLCRKIIFSIEKILQTAEYTVSIAPTLPNNILNVCLRNLIGSYKKEKLTKDPYDVALKWQTFWKSTNIRDPPLFYQCYICRLSWWYYYPFREHIKRHSVKKLKITFQYENTVCYLIAANTKDVRIEYIATEGECYHCGNNFDFHLENRDDYKCQFCKKKFTNCIALTQHEGKCQNRLMAEQKYCLICNLYISGSHVKKHFLQAHTVRSDILVPLITNKYCSLCKQVYHYYGYHVCLKSSLSSQCSSCKRKFATRKLAELHDRMNLSNIACDLCNTVLAKKCMEMEHMLHHTDLFKLVYKCMYCNDIFVDEDSIRLHRIHIHKQKTDKKRCMHFEIPVPERCTREDAIETIDYSKQKSYSNIVMDISNADRKTKTKKLTKINVIADSDDDSQDWSNDTFGKDSTRDEFIQNSSLLRHTSDIDENIEHDDENSNILEDKTNIEDPSNFDENSSKNEDSDVAVIEETEQTDYEEVLSNIINVSSEISNNSNEIQDSENFLNPVIIKTEPIDENEFSENDNSQNDNSQDIISPNDYFSIGVTVKEEVFNQFEQENLIKTEPMDEEFYTNDDSQDFSIDVKKSPVFEETSSVFGETSSVFKRKSSVVEEKSSDIDIKEEPNFNTPEVEYGESNEEFDEMLTFSYEENCYPCSKCNKYFESCRYYILHLKSHHALPDGICPCCGENEEKLGKLVQHLEKHIRYSYVRMKSLSTNYKSYKCINSCRVCHKAVARVDFFKHWEKHAYDSNMRLKLKTFKQEEEFSFNTDRKMKEDMLSATLIQLISTNDCKICCVCQRPFSRKSDTKRHLIEHLLSDAHVKREVTKTLRCQICFEDFHKPEHYKFHMRDHGGLTIYRCDICQKTFSDSSNFSKHSKVHNVSVLICDICNKKFNAKISLERHIAMVHQTALRFPCNICSAVCFSNLERRRHTMKHHKVPTYKCHICSITFHNLKSKWDHEWSTHRLRKFQADCPVCKKSFRKFADVKSHARQAHNILIKNTKEDSIRKEVPNGKICLLQREGLKRKRNVL